MRCVPLIVGAGARGITVHPRPDARHITGEDVAKIAAYLRDLPKLEFNIEGNPEHNLMPLLASARPEQATFVPDSVGQATSDHGYSVEGVKRITPLIHAAKQSARRVSIFVDPDLAVIDAVKKAGADRIELYTEAYAVAAKERNDDALAQVLARYIEAAAHARSIGLGVNAGHDLNLDNLAQFIALVKPDEVSIGHALICDALIDGLEQTVKKYLKLCSL
ncbi:MAG: hypothetical protein RLZZ502_506 [Pseudomonadota bacterium]